MESKKNIILQAMKVSGHVCVRCGDVPTVFHFFEYIFNCSDSVVVFDFHIYYVVIIL